MTIGDGHDLQSPRFAGDPVLEACFDNEHRMMPPETGPAVASVQRALVDLGFLLSYRDVDEQYGPATAAAVSAFKADRGISPSDGIVGPNTMAALDATFPRRPLVAGNFATFVASNRLDPDVADLLNELDGVSDVWAHQVAQFAFHELQVGNLLGMVRAANAVSKIQPLLPPAFVPKLVQNIGAVAGGNALTDPVEVNPNQFQGYTLLNDSVADRVSPGGADRGFAFLLLAHELTHFRNRDFFVALDRSTVAANPGLYVNTAPGAAPQTVASQFIQELICRHVAWRVKRDLDLRNGRTPAPIAAGQLYRFALDLSEHTFDNGYIAGLPAADRNRQVAIWMRSGGQRLFHDDPARNVEVAAFLEGEFLLAQTNAFTTPTVSIGGGE
jgi:hypothetical protein